MAAPKPTWPNDVLGDDWLPPPWTNHGGNDVPEPLPAASAHDQQSPSPLPSTAAPPRVTVDPRARHVFAIAVPQAIIGVVALLAGVTGVLTDAAGALPVAILLVMVVSMVGQAIARAEEPAALRLAWLVGLATTVLALPTAAIQVTLARQPYAGTSFGSAGPLIAATIALGLILILTAVTLAIVSRVAPEEAALLFMAMALVVPAMIGVRTSLTELDSVRALAESSLIAAVASGIAWSVPRAARPMIAPASLAFQFIILWMLGQGPSFSATRGDIVPLTQGGLLALTVGLVVGVPLLAMWSRCLIDGKKPAQRSAVRVGGEPVWSAAKRG